jgi:hypothetical protein
VLSVLTNFNYPVVDHFLDSIGTSASGQIFPAKECDSGLSPRKGANSYAPYAAELATRMLKDTVISPLLRKAFELLGIGKRLRSMLGARLVVEVEIFRTIARHVSTTADLLKRVWVPAVERVLVRVLVRVVVRAAGH